MTHGAAKDPKQALALGLLAGLVIQGSLLLQLGVVVNGQGTPQQKPSNKMAYEMSGR